MRVSVIGGSDVGPESIAVAEEVGERLAENGHTVVCGGLGGVMEGACRGAIRAGGATVGILPGIDPEMANDSVTVPVVTGLGQARNVLVVLNGRAVIAIDGQYGTLSEIAHALELGRPVAGIDTHEVEGVESVESPREAVTYIEAHVEHGPRS